MNTYQTMVIELNVSTTYRTAPRSSFTGVQCVANFSLPLTAAALRVVRLMSQETARPVLRASLTLFL